MKKLPDIKRFQLYIWLGLGYLFISLLNNMTRHPGSFWTMLVNEVWRVIFVTVLNYILFEYTFRFIKLSWKLVIALVLLWVHIMFYSFGLRGWRSLGIALHIYTPTHTYSSDNNEVLEWQMGYSIVSVLFFGIIRHIYNYIKLKQATQQLRIEKQAAELNFLKSQTNPHFLFNTLNNIYSLARDKSDLAPESVLRLSKILRYILYEAGGTNIAIEDELKIINDYIALEKLRYDESLHINFNYNIEDMKQSLPPLLLLPLVENAFKHGVSETRYRPFVDIHVSVNRRQLQLIVKNSADTLAAGENIKENIGLSNLRRQLELLYKEYHLSVQQGESVFTAILQINLASHV